MIAKRDAGKTVSSISLSTNMKMNIESHKLPYVCRCRSPSDRVKAKASGKEAVEGADTNDAHSLRTFL